MAYGIMNPMGGYTQGIAGVGSPQGMGLMRQRQADAVLKQQVLSNPQMYDRILGQNSVLIETPYGVRMIPRQGLSGQERIWIPPNYGNAVSGRRNIINRISGIGGGLTNPYLSSTGINMR